MEPTFKQRVLDIVRQIPAGQVMTYGGVAAAAGSSGASRAVGTIMRNNYNPSVPCHRVVNSDGKIGNYNRGGPEQKAKLLQQEGCTITHNAAGVAFAALEGTLV